MSKYNKMPCTDNVAPTGDTPKQYIPVSPLCTLPILMDSNKGYKNQLSDILSLEELMPKTQRLQIYQMLYMDKLLEKLHEYNPDIEEKETDPIDVINKITPNAPSQTTSMMKTMMKYQKSKDTSALFEMLMPDNPMMSMLLPMLTKNSDNNDSASPIGGDMMSSLLPMMMGMGGSDSKGNNDMLSSMLPMMMGMGGGNSNGNNDMLSSLLPMMMGGGNNDMLSSLLGNMM